MNIKKIKPLFTAVVVTSNVYPCDYKEHNIISPKANKLKEYQKVVAVGSLVRDVKVGDIVKINPTAYAKYEPYKPGDGMRVVINGQEKALLGYEIPTVELDGIEHLFIQERDIEYIVEEYEEDKESPLLIPDNTIIE